MKTRKKSRIRGGTTPRPRVILHTINVSIAIRETGGLTGSKVVRSKNPEQYERHEVGYEASASVVEYKTCPRSHSVPRTKPRSIILLVASTNKRCCDFLLIDGSSEFSELRHIGLAAGTEILLNIRCGTSSWVFSANANTDEESVSTKGNVSISVSLSRQGTDQSALSIPSTPFPFELACKAEKTYKALKSVALQHKVVCTYKDDTGTDQHPPLSAILVGVISETEHADNLTQPSACNRERAAAELTCTSEGQTADQRRIVRVLEFLGV